MPNNLSNSELEKIKNALKYGDKAHIAREVKKSKAFVTQVLNGKYEDNDIIELAIKIGKINKGRNSAVKGALKSL